jgi:formylglycine-generating enzyme required for sulfatase activity
MIRLGFKVVRCRRNLVLDLGFPQSRLGYGPSYHYENLGFRCARTKRARLFRVFRGGCWSRDDATYLAARARVRNAPSGRCYDLGFRCARNA